MQNPSTEMMALGPHEVQLQWGIAIVLRDGLHLSATLYMPLNLTQPSPALFTLTPYVAQSSHEFAVYFASHGYPFLTVDVRGRGNSEGVFTANGNEARDGFDIVEWLARQPYCNGKVAMWGGSYAGHVQWAAAREFPPHLATIVPVAAPFRGVDSPAPNNIFPPYRVQWLTHLSGRASQDKIFGDQRFWSQQFRRAFQTGIAFKDMDGFLGNPSAIFQKWISHPERDEFWDAHNPAAEDYAQFSLPILTITGMYDGNQLGALTHYREHLRHAASGADVQHYLIIGPWDHAGTRIPRSQFCGLTIGPEGVVDLGRLHREWYAWTLSDGPKPSFLKDKVAYYVMGAERWLYAQSLEAITKETQLLYLDSTANPTDVFASGSLVGELPKHSGPDCYVYDPTDVSLAELESTVDPESKVDDRMVYASAGKHLVYHSAPFAQDTQISGFFKLSTWLAIDQPDTDFRASVYEVALDGRTVQLTSDFLRARYRESLRSPKLVTTCQPLRYDFNKFAFISRQIKRGHRLRLVLGPLHSIFWQKNYNSGGVVAEQSMKDARTVTVQLFHDSQHPSALEVPYG